MKERFIRVGGDGVKDGINSEKIMLDYIYLPRNFVSQRRNGGILCRSFKMLDVPLRCFIDHVQCIYYLLYILLPVFSDKHLYLFLGRERVKE